MGTKELLLSTKTTQNFMLSVCLSEAYGDDYIDIVHSLFKCSIAAAALRLSGSPPTLHGEVY